MVCVKVGSPCWTAPCSTGHQCCAPGCVKSRHPLVPGSLCCAQAHTRSRHKAFASHQSSFTLQGQQKMPSQSSLPYTPCVFSAQDKEHPELREGCSGSLAVLTQKNTMHFQRYPGLFSCNFPSSSMLPAKRNSLTHTIVNWHLPLVALPQQPVRMRSLLRSSCREKAS